MRVLLPLLKKLTLAGIGLCLLSLITMPPSVIMTAAKPSGISVSPAFQEVTIQESAQQNTTISYTNHDKQPIRLELSVVDFGTLDETGGVALSGSKDIDLKSKYSLASWLHLASDNLTVEPQSTGTVVVSIINQDSLSPGGHYGAVLAKIISSAQDGKQVSVNQAISSLFFVKKVGGEKYGLKLVSTKASTNWLGTHQQTELRFYNPGNTHVIPRGVITVSNPFGKTIGKTVINQPSTILLPESYRVFTSGVTSSLAIWPGWYHVNIAYGYDEQAEQQSASVSYFGWGLLPELLGLILLSGAIYLLSRRWRSDV